MSQTTDATPVASVAANDGRASVQAVIPPLFSKINDGFSKIVAAGGGLPNAVETAGAALVAEAKAKLQSAGISDLRAVGTLTLDADLLVNTGGLIGPPTANAGAFGHPRVRRTAVSAAVAVSDFPVTDSVIVADSLNLNNRKITIDATQVSDLWIIVRTIKATHGAMITYSPLVNPAAGAAGANGLPNPGQPNWDRNARVNEDANDPSHDGGRGADGGPGTTGPQGLDAPSVTIVALEIDGMPDLKLAGQQGGRGGPGGRGADGGDGQRGRDSKPFKIIVGVDCKHGPGFGGKGGRGGDGGPGGRGGPGGDGGTVVVATQESQLDSLVTSRPFVTDLGGGSGGDPGLQGDPGPGGRGGAAGFNQGAPCKDAPERAGDDGAAGARVGDLGRGSHGTPGTLAYSVITEDEFDEDLESPWILSVDPVSGHAGDRIIVHGLNFSHHATVRMDGAPLTTTFDLDSQLTARIPDDAPGGRRSLDIAEGDQVTNSVPFSIAPTLTAAEVEDIVSTTVQPGDRVALIGASFVSGAAVLVNGATIPSTHRSDDRLELVLPAAVPGNVTGGSIELAVQNPDGLRSDALTLTQLPQVDNGFRANPDGWPFNNFGHGQNVDWGCYQATFGADDIDVSAVVDPVLTGGYFAFYAEFLSHEGHCSGMAATSLDDFTVGRPAPYPAGLDTSTLSPPPDPPPISGDLMRRINVTQGRLLSRELLLHYASQSAEGIDRVEKTVREIETSLRAGRNEQQARVLCFIPSGTVWDVLTDPVVRQAFGDAHSVVPTRITYPDSRRSLDGARLFIYDNNTPGDDGRFIQLFRKDGKLHFSYEFSSTFSPSSAMGFTLGTATLADQLLQDVSLPFSPADTVLEAFVAEVLLSPARMAITDAGGHKLGFFDGQMHADPALGNTALWMDNLLLLRPDANVATRRVIGYDKGTYTYLSIPPQGRSFTLSDIECTADTDDVIDIPAGRERIRVTPSRAKAITCTAGERLPDTSIRAITASCSAPARGTFELALQPGLAGATVLLPGSATDVTVTARLLRDGTAVQGMTHATVPAGKAFRVPREMWGDLDGLQGEVI